TMNQYGASLIVRFGDPKIEIPKLIDELKIDALYFNRDYEPAAKKRDDEISKILHQKKIEVLNFKDHVFYEKNEVLTGQREIYKVFTPYKNKWIETLRAQESIIPNYKCQLKKLSIFKNPESILKIDWYKTIDFIISPNTLVGGTSQAEKRLEYFKKYISNYKIARDIPALNQTSHLSPYLRMGNISVRDMIRVSLKNNDEGHATWLSEIIWRDFYQVILDVFPKVEKNCFKSDYDKISWEGTNAHFKLWCEGKTGYPIVDAAMRCLNETGLMHNRLRMVVASFLTKTLLVDWRKGEHYFAQKLLDFDLAANNGGWQWSASTGVDAQPYFRIFNPYNQSEKFDAEGIFIRKWCPELANFSSKNIHYPQDCDIVEQIAANCFIGKDYPHPIVSYKAQKEKALAMFKAIK
ncbi:MAG: deoxyribodipyrimidine photo-lyase, partial [Bacteriovorax sp.]|nr:deoxyribodipyrimidine photo-lyase [Bacteriovorax sp.]